MPELHFVPRPKFEKAHEFLMWIISLGYRFDGVWSDLDGKNPCAYLVKELVENGKNQHAEVRICRNSVEVKSPDSREVFKIFRKLLRLVDEIDMVCIKKIDVGALDGDILC